MSPEEEKLKQAIERYGIVNDMMSERMENSSKKICTYLDRKNIQYTFMKQKTLPYMEYIITDIQYDDHCMEIRLNAGRVEINTYYPYNRRKDFATKLTSYVKNMKDVLIITEYTYFSYKGKVIYHYRKDNNSKKKMISLFNEAKRLSSAIIRMRHPN